MRDRSMRVDPKLEIKHINHAEPKYRYDGQVDAHNNA